MKRRSLGIALLLAVTFCLCTASAPATDQSALTKFTSAARHRLFSSPSNERRAYWLYLDSTTTSRESVHFTARALSRRARVNPVTVLIDKSDYPISDAIIRAIAGTGVGIKHASRWFRAVAIEADSISLIAAVRLPFVAKADVAITYYRARDPVPEALPRPGAQPPYGPSLFQNQFTKASKLHTAGLSGRGVLIAMLDSGFDTRQPAFDSTRIIATYNFIDSNTIVDSADCPNQPLSDQQQYHGTLTLGAIGGYFPDSLVGPAYGADYMLAKTEITCGGTEIKQEEYNWIAAAEWADSAGADIISSSLGYTVFQDSGSYTPEQLDGHTALITLAAEKAASKNILVVISAGNDRGTAWNHISFPADGDSVCAVGAVQHDSMLTGFSSPGPTSDGRIKPDIVTLGLNVWTASAAGGYRYASGTSLSAPLVAGGAALALEHDTTLTAAQLLSLIRSTGDRASHPDNDYGYGLYDAARSADIIHIDQHDSIHVQVGQTEYVAITASGRSRVTPAISAFALPPGVSLSDHGDGTATLTVDGLRVNLGYRILHLVADVGYFFDTTDIALSTYPETGGGIVAFPNPFKDTLRLSIDTAVGTLTSLTIFNVAGEKIWDRVNESGHSTDIILWDGRNYAGRAIAPGVYILVVQTDRRTETIKLLKVQ
jgi:serine protease AprX